MKKLLALLLCGTMTLSLCSCTNSNENDNIEQQKQEEVQLVLEQKVGELDYKAPLNWELEEEINDESNSIFRYYYAGELSEQGMLYIYCSEVEPLEDEYLDLAYNGFLDGIKDDTEVTNEEEAKISGHRGLKYETNFVNKRSVGVKSENYIFMINTHFYLFQFSASEEEFKNYEDFMSKFIDSMAIEVVTTPEPKIEKTLTYDELIGIVENDIEILHNNKYEFEDYNVYGIAFRYSGTQNLFLVEDKETLDVIAVRFATETPRSSGSDLKYFFEIKQKSILNEIDNSELMVINNVTNDEVYSYDISVPGFDFLEIPYFLYELRPADQSIDVDTINSLKKAAYKYDFNEIKNILENYPDKNIHVDELLSITESAMAIYDNLNIEYDDIEEKSIVTYKNLDKIGYNTHLYTFIDDSSLVYRIGFKNSDWIFFDKYFISVDNSDNITGSASTETDVLSGGSVEEYADVSLTQDEIDVIINTENPIIRFKNSDDEKYLDFELTSTEISALKDITLARNLYREISDYLFFLTNY